MVPKDHSTPERRLRTRIPVPYFLGMRVPRRPYVWALVAACVIGLLVLRLQPAQETWRGAFDDADLGPRAATVRGKTIWLLWYQGWKHAPFVVRAVAKSWQQHNPAWDVVFISRHNVNKYINVSYLDAPHVTAQAKSDIIRLNLLAEYGGVWADATMLCFAPLDAWVYPALRPEGFWAYSYGDEKGSKGIGVWLMIALKHTLVMDRWKALCDEYWLNTHYNATQHEYFWMARLFDRLMKTDAEAFAQWNNVPYLDCYAGYGANLLRNRSAHEGPADASFLDALRARPPYGMKLSTRRIPQEVDSFPTSFFVQRLRAYRAIQIALALDPLSRPRPHLHPMTFFNNTLPTRSIEFDGCSISADKAVSTAAAGVGVGAAGQGQVLLVDTCDFCSKRGGVLLGRKEPPCRPGAPTPATPLRMR